MAIELLNLSSPNDGLGDTLRDGGVKINNNFTFLDTTKQNADADLTAIAGLAGTSGLLRKTAANTWTLDTNNYLTTSATAANSNLLDNLDSSQFLRSDQSDSMSGTLTATAFVGNGSGLTNVSASTLDGIDSSLFLRSDINAIKTSGILRMNDAISFYVGTGQDLRIIHSLDLNYIDLFNGSLIIRRNDTDAIFTLGRETGNLILSGSVTCSQINTGQGVTEVHLMNQNVRTTDAVTFATVNTGQGANELYPMNQAVRTTDSPSFSALTATNAVTAGSFVTGNWTIDQNGTTLEFRYNGVTQMTLSSTGELLVNDRAGEF